MSLVRKSSVDTTREAGSVTSNMCEIIEAARRVGKLYLDEKDINDKFKPREFVARFNWGNGGFNFDRIIRKETNAWSMWGVDMITTRYFFSDTDFDTERVLFTARELYESSFKSRMEQFKNYYK